MSEQEVKDYIVEELNSQPRHCCARLADAATATAYEIECTPWEVLRLVLENKSISGMFTHDYGFHTRSGRHIINLFQENYYNNEL